MDLTEKINPHAVVRYLKGTGWMQYKTKKEYIKIFQKITEKETFYQVIIPIDKTIVIKYFHQYFFIYHFIAEKRFIIFTFLHDFL